MKDRVYYFNEYNLAITKFRKGTKTLEDLLRIAQNFRESENYSKVNYHVVDFRDCKVDFDVTEKQKALDFIKKYENPIKKIIGVYILNSSTETAFSHLFLSHFDNYNYCSTIKCSYDLLNIRMNYLDYERIIDTIDRM